ncbi:MAG TPA: GTP-binding protein [Luteibaculaceae bacterium]|nr:GTP-binding protein [Luteibaculaceae bacterium]
MELLRFFTAGNVDDGKSTLIGRLLLDSGSVSTDIIDTLTRQSKSKSDYAELDLALLTDGLRAEREQGITIDVAYKYFSTQKRKYIIADTPGHVQYTRNMFTGASTAHVALILVDARHGITEQTKRHTIVSHLLNIQNILLVVNKMDVVNYSETAFNEIREAFAAFCDGIGRNQHNALPVSALTGENVVRASSNFSWYAGNTLFDYLESVSIDRDESAKPARFQVQYIIRPQSANLPDYRGYAGQLFTGTLRVGDEVALSGLDVQTRIAKIERSGKEVDHAEAGQAIVLHLSDNFDVVRGTWLYAPDPCSAESQHLRATLCWMDANPGSEGQRLILQHRSFSTHAILKTVLSGLNIHNFTPEPYRGQLALNDFCQVEIKTAEPICFAPYTENRAAGSFVLIHPDTHQTVAAGILSA